MPGSNGCPRSCRLQGQRVSGPEKGPQSTRPSSLFSSACLLPFSLLSPVASKRKWKSFEKYPGVLSNRFSSCAYMWLPLYPSVDLFSGNQWIAIPFPARCEDCGETSPHLINYTDISDELTDARSRVGRSHMTLFLFGAVGWVIFFFNATFF